jgi:hypothetical protein
MVGSESGSRRQTLAKRCSEAPKPDQAWEDPSDGRQPGVGSRGQRVRTYQQHSQDGNHMDSQTITQNLYISFQWITLFKLLVVTITTLFIVSVVKPLFYTIRDITIWRVIDKNTMTEDNKEKIEKLIKAEAILEKNFSNKVFYDVDDPRYEGKAIIGNKAYEISEAKNYEKLKDHLIKKTSVDRLHYESLSKRVDIMLSYFTSDALENPVKALHDKYHNIYSTAPMIDWNSETTIENIENIIKRP